MVYSFKRIAVQRYQIFMLERAPVVLLVGDLSRADIFQPLALAYWVECHCHKAFVDEIPERELVAARVARERAERRIGPMRVGDFASATVLVGASAVIQGAAAVAQARTVVAPRVWSVSGDQQYSRQLCSLLLGFIWYPETAADEKPWPALIQDLLHLEAGRVVNFPCHGVVRRHTRWFHWSEEVSQMPCCLCLARLPLGFVCTERGDVGTAGVVERREFVHQRHHKRVPIFALRDDGRHRRRTMTARGDWWQAVAAIVASGLVVACNTYPGAARPKQQRQQEVQHVTT